MKVLFSYLIFKKLKIFFSIRDAKELQSWIDTINFVCASYSSQPLASGVGSENKFQRPLLPCSHTKLNLVSRYSWCKHIAHMTYNKTEILQMFQRDQLADHEDRVQKLEMALEEHRRDPPDRMAKSLFLQNYKEKDAYLQYEVFCFETWVEEFRSISD